MPKTISKEYGILVKAKGSDPALLTDGSNIFNYKSRKDARAVIEEQLYITCAVNHDIICSVVPLNEDGTYGDPIESYRLTVSKVKR